MDCPTAEARFRRLTERARSDGPLPLFVCLNVTNRCPWDCAYCALPSLRSEELSADEIARVFDSFDGRTAAVTITGGEPALRDDLGEIIRRVREHTGAFIKLDTSGARHARQWDALRLADTVQISIDGPEEIHDTLRGKGTYRMALAAAERLRESGHDVVLNSVICRRTLPHQEAVLELARGLGARYACNMMIQNDLTKRRPELTVTDAEFIAHIESLDAWRDRVPICLPASAVAEYRAWRTATRRERACVAQNNLVFIECNGRMHRCPYVLGGESAPSVRDGALEGFARLPGAACTSCVPNLVAFGLLVRWAEAAVEEQVRQGEALIRPFGLGHTARRRPVTIASE